MIFKKILFLAGVCLLPFSAFSQGGSMGGSSIGQANTVGGPYDLRWSAVDCTGATDDTTKVQTALNTYSSVFVPRNCTITVGSLALPAVINISGDGPTSILKQKNSATGHFLVQSNAGHYTRFFNMTLDGNYQNNTALQYATIRLLATGASDTDPAILVLDTVDFINGNYADVSANYADSAYYTYLFESNTRHLGGADGGSAGILGGVRAFMNNVLIDPLRLPTGASEIGRSGYAFFDGADPPSNNNSLTLNNIQCYRTGRGDDPPRGQLGCIDAYQSGDAVTITNSFSKDAVVRGFTWKADAKNIILSNVVVTNLAGNAANPVNVPAGFCFAQFGGSGSEATVGYNAQMRGLVCDNTAGSGINFKGMDATAAFVGENALISDFQVTCAGGATGYGLDINNVNALTVQNGLIRDCTNTIRVVQAGGLAVGPLAISGVQTINGGEPSFDSASKGLPMWVANNNFSTALTTTTLKTSVSANTALAWTPTLLVNTDSADQTLTTINGVPDGQTVTVKASSASFSLTLGTGGNLGLPNAVVIKDTASALTFRSVAGTLYPADAIQNLGALRTGTGALTIRPADSSTANGNARGTNAIDLQIAAGGAATQVASGTTSVAIGSTNTASGTNSMTIGVGNSATGNTAMIFGSNSTATAAGGLAFGSRANDMGRTNFAALASGRFSNNGDAQVGQAVLRASTTSTSSTRMTSDGAAAGSANIVNLANNYSMSFEITIDVRDTVTGDTATFVGVTNALQRCGISRGANAASTAMRGTCTMTLMDASAGFAALAAPTVTADTTNGGLNVSVVALGTNATRWVANVRPVEVQ